MKTTFLKFAALFALVISSFAFRVAPEAATVEVYIINNCGKEVRVRVQSEGSASSQTFYKNEERKMYARVGSTIEANGESVFTVDAGDSGAKVYLCR